jgi:UDP-galactopyranose mutase
MSYDYLIVGAGLAGAVLAERLASEANKRCLVVDRRNHIGGNCYDRYDSQGVLIHVYGPHYFRTNSRQIVDYLTKFTAWRKVEYKILSMVRGRYWNFPINLNTFEQFIGRPSTSEEMILFLEKWRVPIVNPENSEEVVVSKIGWELYELFFKNYTKKQWGCSPHELDVSVCARIPIRTNRDDRYLEDSFQALPAEGYTRMFEKMLSHPNIEVALNTDYKDCRATKHGHLIYTGMIDEFFGFCHGGLPYRSLRFEEAYHETDFFQPAVQVNFPNDFDYTRIVEIKHATGQKVRGTTIVKEYPMSYSRNCEAYYPVPAPDASSLYEKYFELSQKMPGVSFVGRLATYRYYNMDQVVGMALAEYERLIPNVGRSAPAGPLSGHF